MNLTVLCIKVFITMILNVTFSIIRLDCVVKDRKVLASITGFLQAFVWFLVIKDALSVEEGGIYIALTYATGFCLGTLFAIRLIDNFSKGNYVLKIISSHIELVELLKDRGYGVSAIKTHDDKNLLIASVDKSRYKDIRDFIDKIDPSAFVTVRENKEVYNGYFEK